MAELDVARDSRRAAGAGGGVNAENSAARIAAGDAAGSPRRGERHRRAAIVDAPPLPAARVLAIYRHAYRVRLIEALDETYPVLHGLLGDEAFATLGEAFVAAHPSVHRSIRWYGRELAEFLAAAAALSPSSRFSRRSRCSNGRWRRCSTRRMPCPCRAPRYPRIDPPAWGELTFEFHPSLRRLALQVEHGRRLAGDEPRRDAAETGNRAVRRCRGCSGGKNCRTTFAR